MGAKSADSEWFAVIVAHRNDDRPETFRVTSSGRGKRLEISRLRSERHRRRFVAALKL
jgi:hypothetical protein